MQIRCAKTTRPSSPVYVVWYSRQTTTPAVHPCAFLPLQIGVREDQEAIIASLSPEDYEALLDLRPFMQARPCCVLLVATMCTLLQLPPAVCSCRLACALLSSPVRVLNYSTTC